MKAIILILLSLFCFSSLVWAEEKPAPKAPTNAPTSVDLPRDQVQEYRALDAEARALKAEAALSIQSMIERQKELLEKWRMMTGDKDLSGWELDQDQAKLRRRVKKSEPQKSPKP